MLATPEQWFLGLIYSKIIGFGAVNLGPFRPVAWRGKDLESPEC